MNREELELIKNCTKEKIAIFNFQNKNYTKKENVKIYRYIPKVVACILLILGIVFSQNIAEKIYDLYAKNHTTEYETVNAHTAKFNLDYEESESEIIDLNNKDNISQDAIKFKVSEITMDDTSLDIVLDVEFSSDIASKIKADEYLGIDLSDITITDEESNILYDGKRESQEENEDTNTKNEKFFDSNFTSYVNSNNGSTAEIVISLTIFEQDKYFPKSKELNIEIGNVEIETDIYNKDGSTILNFKGDWKLSFELPENVYLRERNIYKEESENDSENKVLTFNVLSTWTEVILELQANEIAKGDSPQLNLINAIEVGEPTTQLRDYFVDKLMASDEYKEYEDELMKNYLIQETYIEDENGKKYGLYEGTFSNAGGSIDEDLKYKPQLIFDLKDTDMTEKLKLYIKYLDNEYVFNMVKAGEE